MGTSHAFAADPYVVYTANQQVNGAVILRSEPATGVDRRDLRATGRRARSSSAPTTWPSRPSGGLVVADMGVPNQKDGAVIRVDPVTGRQSVVSSGGGLFYDPAGIADRPRRRSCTCSTPGRHQQRRGDPGRPADRRPADLIASNLNPLRLFDFPFGIAVDRDGTIVVVNRALGGALPVDCLIPTGSVIRVNPTTAADADLRARSPVACRSASPSTPTAASGRERVRRPRAATGWCA